LPRRDASVAADAIRPALESLLRSTAAEVAAAAAKVAGLYKLSSPSLAAMVRSEKADGATRIEALRAAAALNDPQVPELLNIATASSSESLRVAGIELLAKRNPAEAMQLLAQKMEAGSTREKQSSLEALSTLNAAAATPLLFAQLEALLAGTLDPALQLELLDAARRQRNAEIERQLERFEKSRPKTEIGPFVESLFGGNAVQGRKIFFEKAEASCNRCHKVRGEGGEVGPDLSLSLTNRTREYLLESIVAPNKTIAPGFENVTVLLKNGVSYLGTVKSETDHELTLNSLEDGLVTVVKADIASRQRGMSGMQQDLAQLLSKRDLRDLVEFLATLK
jgi:quinoprotein glucose dehydrogenase